MKISISGSRIPSVSRHLSHRKEIDSKPILIISRKHRLGDIIMCLPVAQYLSNDYKIFVQCLDVYKDLFECVDYCSWDAFCNTSRKHHRFIDANFIHSNNYANLDTKIKMFFATAEVDPNDLHSDKLIPYITAPSRRQYDFPDNSILVCNVNYNTNSNRSIKLSSLSGIFDSMSNYNFIVSSIYPQSIPKAENVHNFSSNTPSLLDFIDMVNSVDAILTVDTGALHLAGALGTPTVALFGPTDPRFFARHYGSTICIDHNDDRGATWDMRTPDCFENLSDDVICNSIEKISTGFDGHQVVSYNNDVLYERNYKEYK